MEDFPQNHNDDPFAARPQEGRFITPGTSESQTPLTPHDNNPFSGPEQQGNNLWSNLSIIGSWLVILLLVGFIMASPFLFEPADDQVSESI